MRILKRFVKDEKGLETVEWGFVLGLVLLIAVLAFIGSRASMQTIFRELDTELQSAASW